MHSIRSLLDVAVLNVRVRRESAKPASVLSDVRLHVPQAFLGLAESFESLGSYVLENYPHDPVSEQVANDDVFRVQVLAWIVRQINHKEVHFARASVAIRMWTVVRGDIPAADAHVALGSVGMIGRPDLNFMNAFVQVPISTLRAYVTAELKKAADREEDQRNHSSTTCGTEHNTVDYDPLQNPGRQLTVRVDAAS
jgi:hypothetical protein